MTDTYVRVTKEDGKATKFELMHKKLKVTEMSPVDMCDLSMQLQLHLKDALSAKR